MKFKAIPDYEGYEVSDCGEIRSLARDVQHKNGKQFKIKGRDITKKLSGNRKYYHVILYKKGAYKLFRIHQLVAKAWLPNPHNYKVVNHKDGDRYNNNVSNLEWTTQAKNIIHCKTVLKRNLRISLTKIETLYSENVESDLKSFINLLKLNCK